jgi:PAS domain S-box-containing protein
VIHPDDREPVWQRVQDAVGSGEKYLLEYRLTSRDGDLIWVWEHGQAICDDDGEVVALEGFISDVTVRKLA